MMEQAEGKELERQALALWKEYGFFLPAAHKAFLRRLAAHLGWVELQGALK